jgi:uncharacterized protein YdaU (DUF1376 family)
VAHPVVAFNRPVFKINNEITMSLPPCKSFPILPFLDDTNLLKNDEYGVYIRLLEYMWQCGGKLANDDTKIARYLRISLRKWQTYKQIMRKFFIFSDKTFTHGKLKKEYDKAVEKSRKNALNARKRWSKQTDDLLKETAKIVSVYGQKNEKVIDSTAVPSHMQSHHWTCAHASTIREKNKKIDDRFSLTKAMDKMHKLEELQLKLNELFAEHGMSLLADKFLAGKWLDDGISIEVVCKIVKKVIRRISSQGLDQPRSFAYFTKEIRKSNLKSFKERPKEV